MTDPFGRTTRTAFDSSGNVLTTIGPGEGTEYVYSDAVTNAALQLGERLPNGLLLETWRVFDHDNNPATRPQRLTTQPDTVNAYYTSDTATASVPGGVKNLLLSTTDNRTGVTIRYTYAPDGQVRETFREWTDGQGSHSVREGLTTYDAAGRVATSTSLPNPALDADGQTTTTHYDALGRVDWTKDDFDGYTINTYDLRGNLIRTFYPDHTETRTVFDDMGRAVYSMERFASSTSATVDPETGAVSITNDTDSAHTAVVTQTIYDAAGRVTGTERFKNARVALDDDPANTAFLKSTLSINGTSLGATSSVFDEAGRVVETVDVSDLRSGTVYYPDGRVHYAGPLLEDAPLKANGDPTNWYEAADPKIYFYRPLGPDEQPVGPAMITSYVYDQPAAGGLLYDVATDAKGNATKTYKDALGRVVKTEFADDSFTQTLYGVGGNAVEAPEGLDIDMPDPTDSQDELVDEGWPGVPAGGQHVVKIEQRKSDDPVVAAHDLYDSSGRLTDVWQPAVTDALATDNPSTEFDERVKRPHWHYTYDANGNQLTQVDPNVHTTSFGYDLQNRRTSRTLPSDDNGATSDTETWTYDARGRVRTHVDFKGQTTAYEYDDDASAGGRPLNEYRFAAGVAALNGSGEILTGSAAEQTNHHYDALGREDSVTDYAGGNSAYAATYGFDPVTGAEIQTTETLAGQALGTVHHLYDEATGQLQATWTGSASDLATAESSAYTLTEYEYNYLGQLWKVHATRLGGVTTSQVTEYTYDSNGNLDLTTLPNGVTEEYEYDGLNRLKILTAKRGTQTVFYQRYTLLNDGQRQSVREERYDSGALISLVNTTWTYDALSRLTKEVRNEDPSLTNGTDDFETQEGNDYTDEYFFDLAGNRVGKTHDEANTANDTAAGYAYTDRDQLKEEGPDANNDRIPDIVTTAYAYDANGSQIQKDSERFVWDLRNRMAGYDANGDGSLDDVGDVTYAYDEAGQRLGRTEVTSSGTQYTQSLLDRQNLTGYAKAVEERDSLGNAMRSYVLGSDLIAQFGAAGTLYFLKDGHGATRGLVSATGVAVQRYDFDAYGNAVSFTDAAGVALVGDPLTTWLQPDGYRDFATGLDCNGVRDVDPSLGRFLRLDPRGEVLGDTLNANLYAYANSNPVMGIDPTGRFFAMVGTMLGYSATILHFALDPGRNFEGSWGLGRELTRSFDYDGADAFALADLHQASQELQLMDIVAEAKRGFAAASASAQLAWDAIYETFDLNEQILLDLVVSPFFASACFAVGTPVVVGVNADGSYTTKAIEEICAGDRVLARDEREEKADEQLRLVGEVFSRETDHLRILTARDSDGHETRIRTTDGHLIWAVDRGWTKASHLEVGDRLSDARGGRSVVILATEREDLPEPIRVYTFRVEADHTYFVADAVGTGQLTAWVHNVCGGAAHLEDTLREEKGLAGQTRAERRFFTPEGAPREADVVFTGPSGRAAGDSKYVANWTNSIFNPNNPSIGAKQFAALARAKVVNQAKDYLRSGFKTVEYMSNSREFISTYSRMFEEAGIDMRRVTFTYRPQ